jgi:hypothetical protein
VLLAASWTLKEPLVYLDTDQQGQQTQRQLHGFLLWTGALIGEIEDFSPLKTSRRHSVQNRRGAVAKELPFAANEDQPAQIQASVLSEAHSREPDATPSNHG